MKALRKLLRLVGICTLSFFAFFNECVSVSSYEQITVKIPVKCVYMPEFDNYIYGLSIQPLNDASPVPNEDNLSVLHDNIGTFTINVSESGTFRYKIFEPYTDDEIITQDNITYTIQHDMSVYNITLFVTENADGKLNYSVSAIADENEFKTDSIKFKDKIVLDEEFSDDESSDDDSSDDESSDDESSNSESSSPVTESSVNSQTSVPPPDSDKTTVLTGDTANTSFIIFLFLISLCTSVIIILSGKKRFKDDDIEN